MSLKSLIATGTKLWLDSVDPAEVQKNFAIGATGATSNPIIISDIIKAGQCDPLIQQLIAAGVADEPIAWQVTDRLVSDAQKVFRPIWDKTKGNDGYVSFELDPTSPFEPIGASDCGDLWRDQLARILEREHQAHWIRGDSERYQRGI